MVTKTLLEPGVLCCPNCKGNDFMFSGLQMGYGYVPDMELWTCGQCYSTFSVRSLDGKFATADPPEARDGIIQDAGKVKA